MEFCFQIFVGTLCEVNSAIQVCCVVILMDEDLALVWSCWRVLLLSELPLPDWRKGPDEATGPSRFKPTTYEKRDLQSVPSLLKSWKSALSRSRQEWSDEQQV